MNKIYCDVCGSEMEKNTSDRILISDEHGYETLVFSTYEHKKALDICENCRSCIKIILQNTHDVISQLIKSRRTNVTKECTTDSSSDN